MNCNWPSWHRNWEPHLARRPNVSDCSTAPRIATDLPSGSSSLRCSVPGFHTVCILKHIRCADKTPPVGTRRSSRSSKPAKILWEQVRSNLS